MRPLLILIAFFISLQSYSQTIHFMMVADNDESEAGVAAGKMAQYMLNQTFVPNLRNYTGLNVHVTELTGRSFSLQNLNNELNRLQSSSGDVIFFYYCGHGYNAGDNDPFPMLWFGNLSSVKKFSSVYNALSSKPHRLLIAIAEACNAVAQSRPRNHSINSRGNFEPHFAKTEKYRKLFCESSGDYIMSSSSKGELSQFINNWGIFSTAFIESFEKAVENNANPNPTWEDIFNNIVSKTIKDAYENVGTSQRPQWKKNSSSEPHLHHEDMPRTADAVEQYNKAVQYYNSGNYSECIKYLRPSANQNFALAQYLLGYCYLQGLGAEKDGLLAFQRFKQAANQNLASAQYFLGWCYETGTGTYRNIQKAKEYYQKAANQGDDNAIQKLKTLNQ